ncbi:hypothetical protein ACMYSQ_010209 [Aspergillus niger]
MGGPAIRCSAALCNVCTRRSLAAEQQTASRKQNRLNRAQAQGIELKEAIQTRDERIAQRGKNDMGAFPCHVNHPHSTARNLDYYPCGCSMEFREPLIGDANEEGERKIVRHGVVKYAGSRIPRAGQSALLLSTA